MPYVQCWHGVNHSIFVSNDGKTAAGQPAADLISGYQGRKINKFLR
jgi:hypothetical protein